MTDEEKKVIADGFLDKKLFRCKQCRNDQDEESNWISWNEARKMPIEKDTDGNTIRAALFCKDKICNNQVGIYTIISLPEIEKINERRKAQVKK